MKKRLAPPGARWQRRARQPDLGWTVVIVYATLLFVTYLLVTL